MQPVVRMNVRFGLAFRRARMPRLLRLSRVFRVRWLFVLVVFCVVASPWCGSALFAQYSPPDRQLSALNQGFSASPEQAPPQQLSYPSSSIRLASATVEGAKPQDTAQELPILTNGEANADPVTAASSDVLDQVLVEQDSDGLDDEKLPKPSLSSAITPLLSIIGSLLVVIAVFLLLMTLMKKITPQGKRILPSEVFENLGHSFLTQKLQVHLLRVGNKLVLVSVTQDGVSPITEVENPDDVVPIIATCRGGDRSSSSNLFKRTLSELSKTGKDSYFGEDASSTQMSRVTPVPKSGPQSGKTTTQNAKSGGSRLDIYSEPEESLADMLAAGLVGKGVRHA